MSPAAVPAHDAHRDHAARASIRRRVATALWAVAVISAVMLAAALTLRAYDAPSLRLPLLTTLRGCA